jgi:hypothetical protein
MLLQKHAISDPPMLCVTTEASDIQASLLHDYSSQTNQTTEATNSATHGKVTKPSNNLPTLLCLTGKEYFVSENRGKQ